MVSVQIHQGEDDLAVRVGFELYFWGEALAQGNVVVYFTVDGEDDLSVLAEEGLGTRVCEF